MHRSPTPPTPRPGCARPSPGCRRRRHASRAVARKQAAPQLGHTGQRRRIVGRAPSGQPARGPAAGRRFGRANVQRHGVWSTRPSILPDFYPFRVLLDRRAIHRIEPHSDPDRTMNTPYVERFPGRPAVAVIPLVLTLWATAPRAIAQCLRQRGGMTDREAQVLAQQACTSIPDGAYWLNVQTGAWGYVGNPRAQGSLGDKCQQRTGDGGGVVRRGPFVSGTRQHPRPCLPSARPAGGQSVSNGDGYYIDVQQSAARPLPARVACRLRSVAR